MQTASSIHDPRKGQRRIVNAILAAGLVLALLAAGRTGSAPRANAAAAATPATVEDDQELIVDADGVRYFVRLQMLMDSSASAADADAARSQMLARFPGATPVEHRPGEVTAQFVTNGYVWAAKTAEWSYNPAGKKAGLAGEDAALNAAAATWAAQGANFHFSGGGATAAGTGGCSNDHDGHNTVGWAAQPGKVLAVTCSWWTSKGAATEFDMQLDPDWSWTTGSAATTDLQSVVLHEFGHALGLNHSTDIDAVMFASYKAGTLKRTPNTDDRAGILSLYGASTTTAPPSPSPSTAPSNSPTPITPPTPPAPSAPSTLAIRRGANLTTWPGSDTATTAALSAEGGGSVRMVYEWDAVAKEWRRFSPGAPTFVNDLTMLRRDHAYWVIASSDTSLLVGE